MSCNGSLTTTPSILLLISCILPAKGVAFSKHEALIYARSYGLVLFERRSPHLADTPIRDVVICSRENMFYFPLGD